MKTTNKILVGIVAGIILLVTAALVITLTRPEPTYQAEDTPDGVAYNYLLALQNEDYERAYSYLSPGLKGYPRSVDEFATDIQRHSYSFNMEASLSIESTNLSSLGIARVTLLMVWFNESGLFDSRQYTTTFEMTLHLENGIWKIHDSSRYFLNCWLDIDGC